MTWEGFGIFLAVLIGVPLALIFGLAMLVAGGDDAINKATDVHYLPMRCRVCERNRLQYDPVANTIECEKCHTRWPDRDDYADASHTRQQKGTE